MKPKARRILQDAIEHGVKRGWYRAHKHNENPNRESVWEDIEDSVMAEITEYFTFEEEDF